MTANPRLAQRISSALIAAVTMAASPSLAAITPTGDVSPANPSTWTSSTTGYIGNTSDGSITVNTGSTLRTLAAYLGNGTGATGLVTVSGTNATWTNTSTVGVGQSGTGSLTIINGGKVSSNFNFVGGASGATGSVSISGSGSSWTSSGTIYDGYFGTGTVSLAGSGVLSTSDGYVGFAQGSTGILLVDGTGSLCTSTGAFYVGNFGTGTLSLTNGGKASTNLCYVGSSSGATGSVTIDGIGSLFTSSGTLYNGYSGSGALNITRGGSLTSFNSYLGYAQGSAAIASVDGTGSGWTSNGTLFVGNSGAGAVSLTNGGKVVSGICYLGFSSGGAGSVAVDGTSCSWTSNGNLYVGGSGAGTMTLTNGGTIHAGNCYLGNASGSTGSISVSGTNSTWTNGTIYVGNLGAGTLTLANGGKFSNSSLGFVGSGSTATGLISVSGSGSSWTNSGSIYFGSYGSGSLSLSSGGQFTNGVCYLGDFSTGIGTAAIDGTSSTWTTTYSLYVGNSGAGTVHVTNGGRINVNSSSFLGNGPGSTANATVDGPGSTWSSSQGFYVGYNGSATLSLTNGGWIFGGGQGVHVGYGAGSQGIVTVDGSATKWSPSGLYVGERGSGTLNIMNGGNVSLNALFLGMFLGATGTVLVDGVGSTLVSPSFVVGSSGNGVLNITNGGKVTSSSVTLGYDVGSQGVATIDGSAPPWQLANLTVGRAGAATLDILNGASVAVSGSAFVAYYGTAPASVYFGASGGTLTTQSLYASPAHFAGTGTINARGLVSDINLLIDATHGLTRTMSFNDAGQNITFNLDLSGAAGPVGDLGVGYLGAGSLTIQDGATASCNVGYLGFQKDAVGIATISGPGSSWTVGSLRAGLYGSGILNIAGGASVTVTTQTYLGFYNSGNGSINFGPGGGTLFTQSLYAAPSQITGTGAINARGMISDVNLLFDATHGLVQSLTSNNSAQHLTINLDLTSQGNSFGDLGAGFQGVGTLSIRDGIKVSSLSGVLGYRPGSNGSATVYGSGSSWTIKQILLIGKDGIGSLSIGGGGQVICSSQASLGAMATLYIDGPSSALIASAQFGLGANSIVTISNGGSLVAQGLSLPDSALLAMNVGDGSVCNVKFGTVSFNGTIRLKSAPGLATGTYSPISAFSYQLSGPGTVQALGGSWNTASLAFTVSPASRGTASQPLTINTFQTQRIVINDPTTNDIVEAAFPSTNATSSITLTASPLPSSQSALLQSTLTAGAVLTGWNFTTSGYTAGNPVALSLQIGTGYASTNLAVWQFNGSAWTPFATPDLSYNGTHASFTVTSLTTFALAVPIIPTTLSSVTLLTSHNMLPKVTDLTCGGTLNLSGFNQQLNSLCDATATGLITNTSPLTSTLTLAPASPTSTTFTGNITGNLALTKSGPGTTTLANYQATGPINVSAGKLTFSPTPAPRNTPAVLLQSSSLSLAPATTLDLSNHDLLLHNANPAQIESLIGTAYFFGLWNHPGITSSSAQANPITTLAILSGTDYNTFSPTPGTFDNTPVLNSDTLLKFTYVGDLNLDGLVNDDDLFIFNGAYFFTGTGNYALGDLNFDGLVNDDDLFLFNGNYFFPPASPLADISPLSPSEIENQNPKIANPLTPTPEPTTLLLLSLTTPLLLLRRPRHPFHHS